MILFYLKLLYRRTKNNDSLPNGSDSVFNAESKNQQNASGGRQFDYDNNKNLLTVPSLTDEETNQQAESQLKYIDQNQKYNEQQNLVEFWDFVDKWRVNRTSSARKIENIFKNSSVSSVARIKSDAKRLVPLNCKK